MATHSDPIVLKLPAKYASSSDAPPSSPAPALDWLTTTWSVTHSTLSMWRSARNVRITYKLLPASSTGFPGWTTWSSTSPPRKTARSRPSRASTRRPTAPRAGTGAARACSPSSRATGRSWAGARPRPPRAKRSAGPSPGSRRQCLPARGSTSTAIGRPG